MYGYRTEEEAIFESLQYLIYTNPNFHNMCQISHSVGGEDILERDSFINSKEVTRKSKALYYTYGWTSPNGCERVSTGKVTIYANRREHCSAPHPKLWGWDIKSSMCYAPVAQKPPAINTCEAKKNQGSHGNPILAPTREKVEISQDITDEGTMPLEFRRVYRSHRARDKDTWFNGYFVRAESGSLGEGWVHNHEMHLATSLPSENGQGSIHQVRVQMGDGSFTYFNRDTRKGADYVARSSLHTLAANSAGWVFENKENNVRYVFNIKGQLLEQERLNGWRHIYTYDANDRLKAVHNTFGRALFFTYHADGKLAQVVSSDQRSIGFAFTGNHLTSVQQADGSSREYLYDDPNAPGLLSGAIDENGIRYATFGYDAEGWARYTQKAGGVERYSIPWHQQTTNSVETKIVDPLNTSRTFSHKLYGSELLFMGSSGAPASPDEQPRSAAAFDANGLEQYFYDRQYNLTNTVWDTVRRLPVTVKEAEGKSEARTTNTEWHPQWRLPTKITELGRTTVYIYDERGNRISETIADTTGTARTTLWTYTPQSLVATETAPNGATTSYQYDSLGNLTQSTNALGHTHRYTHDGAGRVLTHTDPNGVLTTTTYDLRGRMLSASVGGITSTYTYTPSGQLASARFAHGHHISYQYDAAQRLVGWSDNRGAHASYQLDPMGNRTSEEIRNAQGHQVWQLARSINSLNRVESTTQAGQTTRHYYDANGDLTHVTNGLGETTTYGLDALRRVKTSPTPPTPAPP
jgi:YD repeat-containing protein